MKILYLVRHAKSDWDHPGLSDFERPLMPKGIRKTRKMVDLLRDRGICPGLMVSSPATRAIGTATILARGLGYPEDQIRQNRKIYEGYYDTLLDIIYETSNEVESLMIVGHNPTITHVVNLFLHPGIEDLTTSSVAAIRFHCNRWEDAPASVAEKAFILSPKETTK